MAHAVHFAEFARDGGLGGVAQVKDEGPARRESIGEEPPARVHDMLGVMRTVPEAGDRHRGHDLAVAARVRSDVEDREEVGLSQVSQPGPEIPRYYPGGGRFGLGRASG